jgi:hypothetical protein
MIAMEVFVSFIGLFYTIEGVGESLALGVLYFFVCIYLFYAS